MIIKEIIRNKEDTVYFIKKYILPVIKKETILLLNGTLGSGKTFFTNVLLNMIFEFEGRATENITSPTFNLVKIYNTNNFDIHHFDLYRLKNVEELYEFDLNEAFSNVSIIEWSDIIKDMLPYSPIELSISFEQDYRIYTLSYEE